MKSGDFTRLLETEVSFWMLKSIIQRHGQLGASGGIAGSSQRRPEGLQYYWFYPHAMATYLQIHPITIRHKLLPQ